MPNQYPNSGALFQRPKRTPKAPDFGGDITVDAEVLDFVLAQVKAGQPVKLEINGWKRQGKNDSNFISLTVAIPYDVRKGSAPQQGAGRQYSRPYPDQSNAIQTSRGQYDRTGGQRSDFRKELNDDIPDFGASPRRGGNAWD